MTQGPERLRFTGRIVTYEDGRIEAVSDFEIVNRPVTVEDMRQFCEATGYVTSAERKGSLDTFRNNAYLRVVEPEFWGQHLADFLSHDDAAAFCAWSGYRLPTEGEFMVAALVDDAVHDDWMDDDEDVVDDWIASGRIADLATSIITDTRVGNRVVVRSGPHHVKQPGWEEDRERSLVEADDPAGTIVRVVK